MADRSHRRSMFLSHNRVDKPFVRRVHRHLSDHGIRSWLDEAEILPGDSLIEKIQVGLSEMDYLGVFLSPDSIKSPWVRKELNIVMTREIQYSRVTVIPILLNGLRENRIPSILADKYFVDFRDPNPFQKGVHELLMVLDDRYAELVSKAIEDLESPDELSAGIAGLLALLKDDLGQDAQDLALALHRYHVLKDIVGVDLKQAAEFVSDEDPEAGVARVAKLLQNDIPYALWPYLASVEVLKGIFRTMGKKFDAQR